MEMSGMQLKLNLCVLELGL